MRFLRALLLFFFLALPAHAFKPGPSPPDNLCRDALSVITIEEALLEYQSKVANEKIPLPVGKLQYFINVGNRKVYNPTQEFIFNGKVCIAARVEGLHDQANSEVIFFERGAHGFFQPILGAPVFKMQDPLIIDLGDEFIFGGVEIYPHPNGRELGYHTVFYRGPDILHLKYFARGPETMKGIRIARLPDGTFVVATRPQNHFHPDYPELNAGRGMIGMTIIKSLDELTESAINDATLYPDLFPHHSWGGINQLIVKGSLVYTIGHWANFGKQRPGSPDIDRNYYAFVASWNPQTQKFSKLNIILERSNLRPGISKRDDLQNVLYTGGLDATNRILWVGTGDAQTYRVLFDYDLFANLRHP